MSSKLNPLDSGTLDLIKAAARIDEVVGRYVRLSRYNSENLRGLCPFHKERTPSFNVNVARGVYKCFGCGVSGDVIGFIRKIEGVRFMDAVRQLAADAGVELAAITRADVVTAKSTRALVSTIAKESEMYWQDAKGNCYSFAALCGQMYEFICEWFRSDEFTEDLAEEMHEMADICVLVGMYHAETVMMMPTVGKAGESPYRDAYSQLPRAVRKHWESRVRPEIPGAIVLPRVRSSKWERTDTSTTMLLDAAERREAELWLVSANSSR